MSIPKVILVFVCLVGLNQLVWSQSGNMGELPRGRAHGIPGYLDPTTGKFTTRVQAEPQASEDTDAVPPPPLTGFGGTWNVNLTVQLYTKPASGDIVVCDASLDVDDTYPAFGFGEGVAKQATVSGSTATCDMVIPYLWYLSTPKTDMVTVSYDVTLYHVYTVGSVSQANISRHTDHTIGIYALPANGAVTTTTWVPRL